MAWQGELETGSVTIDTADSAPQVVTPVAAATPSTIFGPVIERVVNDLEVTRGVKIRYQMVEGAAAKKIASHSAPRCLTT